MKTLSMLAALALVTATSAAGRAEEWSFDVRPGERLEIDLETGGEVEVRSGTAGQVSVHAEVHGRDAKTVRLTVEKVTAGVRVASEQTSRRRSTSASVDLVIRVPEKFDVHLESMGGPVTVVGVEGEISGETMGGDLELERVRGEIDLQTMGGEVRVVDSVADGKVSTMGGDVVLKNVRGGLRGSTMGGNVRIHGGDTGSSSSEGPNRHPAPQSGDVVRISSMGGSIDVASAPNGADVETMGGNVRIQSATRFVKASTMGGDIDVRRVDGDIEASTMGGDVTVRVVGAGGEVELESMSGTIELTLPASFSGTFDVELQITKNSRRSYEIRSDFPLSERREREWRYGRGTPRKSIFGEGRSGGGEHLVKILTVNGNVVIRKGD